MMLNFKVLISIMKLFRKELEKLMGAKLFFQDLDSKRKLIRENFNYHLMIKMFLIKALICLKMKFDRIKFYYLYCYFKCGKVENR